MSTSRDPISIDMDRMEGLIPICDKIQDILDRTKTGQDSIEIQLPQIVVIGSQSCGKSSLLENLVGQPFLPRGMGIVTRCPISLRMIHTKDENTRCEFEHIENTTFTDFKKVEQEIIAQTATLAGTNSGITSDSIKLTVYSPNVLNLTVVDLPGLVQINSKDQPEDIVEQTRNLVLEYISSENAIILAVCRGDSDIANNESLQIARQVDPLQERTIVVLTHLDRVQDYEVEKVAEVLNGNVIQVNLGIVGVINRNEEDNHRNKPKSEVLKNEKKILEDKFKAISNEHGITNLANKLVRVLLQRILATCPDTLIRLRNLITAAETELKSFGVDGDISDSEKRKILYFMIDKFSKKYKAQIDGMSRSEIKSSPLTSGAQIDLIINRILMDNLNEFAPCSDLRDDEIMRTIRNSTPVGSRMANPEVALDHFIKEESKKLIPVANHSTKLVYQEMVDMIDKCLESNNRFPNVNEAIRLIVKELLESKMEITHEILETYFEIQSSSAFTADTRYSESFKEIMLPITVVDLALLPITMLENEGGAIRNLTSSANFRELPGPSHLTPEQLKCCKQMRNLASQVFEIGRKQLQDFIARAILYTLVYKTVDNVGGELNARLNESENIADELIREREDIHERRVQLKNNLEEYKNALELLDDLRSVVY